MEFRAEKEATIAAASARCRAKSRISIAAQIRWAAKMSRREAKTKLREHQANIKIKTKSSFKSIVAF
jgi:hypothetical protein